jgi:TonB family protein
LFWTFACSSNLEADLRKAAAGPDSVVIVKTSEGGYLAFPGVGVKKIEGSNVTLKARTLVTKGSGTMPEASIVREIRDTRAKASPGGFVQTEMTITGDSGNMTVKNEVLDSETVIQVAEIISPSGKTDDERSFGTEVPGAPVKPDPAVSSVERTPQQIGPGGEGAPTGGLPERVAEAPVQPKKVGSPQTIQGGVLNSQAISLPQPEYPAVARSQKASGPVSVKVTVDETGNVIAASVLKGHPLLGAAAVEAARKAKFRPTMLSGQPAKVTGVVNYNFVLP